MPITPAYDGLDRQRWYTTFRSGKAVSGVAESYIGALLMNMSVAIVTKDSKSCGFGVVTRHCGAVNRPTRRKQWHQMDVGCGRTMATRDCVLPYYN